MAEHVLGKVTGDYGQPSGPDALLDIVVDPRWLREARTIEIDLPRHLSCVACAGAGCDICGQSGALTVRERFELPEVLRVTLPKHDLGPESSPDSERATLLLRIRGRGGLPKSGSVATRGRLLLRLRCKGAISECVREVADDQLSIPYSSSREALVVEGVPSSSSTAVGSQQTLASQRATPQRYPPNPPPEPSAPETRRSTSPATRRVDPQPLPGKGVEKQPGIATPAVARAPRIRGIDIAVGLFVMLLGAALAWFLL